LTVDFALDCGRLVVFFKHRVKFQVRKTALAALKRAAAGQSRHVGDFAGYCGQVERANPGTDHGLLPGYACCGKTAPVIQRLARSCSESPRELLECLRMNSGMCRRWK
jgi:hypothetical protein